MCQGKRETEPRGFSLPSGRRLPAADACRFCIGCVAGSKPHGPVPSSARGTTGNHEDRRATSTFTRRSAQSPAGKGRTGHPAFFGIALVCTLLSNLNAARWSPPSRTRPCIVSSRSAFLRRIAGRFHVLWRRFFHIRRIMEIMAGPASGDTAV